MKILLASLAFTVATAVLVSAPRPPSYTPAQIREVFFLLGMHYEYFGKAVGSSETFFSNEHAAEKVYLAHSENLRTSLGLKTLDEAWQVVDSFYTKTGDAALTGRPIYVISDDAFVGYGDDAALGYLAGAAVRHWEDGRFRFANATHKAQLIGSLLAFRDCGDVEIRTYPARIPNNSEVRLQPSASIRSLITSAIAEREKNQPNQAPDRTAPSGTAPAAQEPRH